MSSIDELLAKRTKVKEVSSEPTKVRALAMMSNDGQLSGFGGIFKEPVLAPSEEESLRLILTEFKKEDGFDILADLSKLRTITKEVKAIHTQALLLHGERIKQAQDLLKNYKEGAFSRWLLTIYGNRQTPYNFLQFYEFFQLLSHEAKRKAEALPRQAIYSLATRKGSIQEKEHFLESCQERTKRELLEEIRDRFPLEKKDKRKSKSIFKLLASLSVVEKEIKRAHLSPEDRKLLLDKTTHLVSLLTSR